MKKIIMHFESPDKEIMGIIFNSIDVHILDVECLADITAEYYATQDYFRFEGRWLFDSDSAYETWYSEFGELRDTHLASLIEYLEANEVTVKIYSEIENSRMPNALPFDQYVEIPKLIRVR